jgi:hypothetical protein
MSESKFGLSVEPVGARDAKVFSAPTAAKSNDLTNDQAAAPKTIVSISNASTVRTTPCYIDVT